MGRTKHRDKENRHGGPSGKQLRRLGEQTVAARRELSRISRKRKRLDERIARLETSLIELEGRLDALQAPTATETTPTEVDGPGPDASWTVARLRQEAAARGLTGLSRASKADLVARLS